MGRKINFIWKASDTNVPSIYKKTIYVLFFCISRVQIMYVPGYKRKSVLLAQDFFFSSHSVTSHEISQQAPPTGVSTTLKNFFLLQWGLFLVWSWTRASGNGGSAGKESAYNAGDLGLIPGLGRSPGEGKGYPLQYSVLENSMDCIVRGVTKSRTRLSDFHFLTLVRLSSCFVMDQNLRESSHLLVILQNLLGPLCGFFRLRPNYLFTYHFTKIYTIHT